MKTAPILAALCGLFFACEDIEQKATAHLKTARTAYVQGDYRRAKAELDSIKQRYPKAFDTRRAGNLLRMDIEQAEQTRNLNRLDSLLASERQAVDAIKGRYILEKEAEYQTIGHYLHPSQTLEKNLNRSYLRFQVNEKGTLSLTSIYCGKRHIHHTRIKATTPDGTFVETPAAKEVYETAILDNKIEKAEFKAGDDNQLICFIQQNHEKEIRVDYQGEHPYTTRMSKADRQAAAAVCELARHLATITRLEEEKKEAGLKLEFVRRKQEAARQKNND